MASSWGAALLIAWRNLTLDRARFAVTMIGIIFAVVLIAMQAGLFLGFSDTITLLVRQPRADVWVMAHGTRNFEISRPIRESELHRVLEVEGVDRAERLVARFTVWKKPQGGDESILVVGFDPNGTMMGLWDEVSGNLADLRKPDSVMIDELFMRTLGITAIGDTAEIAGHRARVVGFTRGFRSFTTSPIVFTMMKTALDYSLMGEEQQSYVIATVRPGHDPREVAKRIVQGQPSVDAWSSADFATKSRDYWMFTTGAGGSVIVGALLGMVVGVVIVAQVLYATTMDHLWELGTLRAMGAPSSFIVRIILGQAIIAAVIGHAIGITAALALSWASRTGTTLILVPPSVAALLFLVTLGMCMLASLVSIRKVLTIDPAMVFQR